MAWGLDALIKKGKAQLSPPKRPNITYAKDPVAPKNKYEFDQRENFISTVRNNPDTKDVPIESIYTAWQGGKGLPQSPAFAPPPLQRSTKTGTASSGGGRRRSGGGGGGGGSNAAALAQSQLDFLLPYLGGRNYTAQPMTAVRQAISDREGRIGTSTAADMATSTGA